MVPCTRRRLLCVATAAVSALSGCGQFAESTASPTATERPDSPPGGGTERNPPTLLVRAASETPPIVLGAASQEGTEGTRTEYHSSRLTHAVVDSHEMGERLTVADDADGEAMSSFLAETDFARESLYLETNRVPECYRLRLCRISWYPDKVETDYVRQIRPYDEACSADEMVFESRLIRIPAALDEESVNSFGSSIGSGGRCERGDVPRAESSSDDDAGTASETAAGGEGQ